MHELNESTKRLIDFASVLLALVSLSQIALIVSILAGLASFAWTGMRFYDRVKYGPRTTR